VKIDSPLVSHVARLAALEVTPAETEALAGQLTRIVEHFEALRSIPDALLDESPDLPATPLRNDVPVLAGVSPERNAPEFSHGHFVVPRVVTRAE